MNRISFYGGVILIIIGLFIWLFKKNYQIQNNSIKAFGMEFNLSTPAFVVIAFGIILMFISTNFPTNLSPWIFPKNYITIKDAVYASKFHPARYNGYRAVIRACNNTEKCSFPCNDATADYSDPDRGSPKRCIINYFCSNDPNNPLHFDEGQSDTASYSISCQN